MSKWIEKLKEIYHKNYSRYEKEFELADGNYSLYYFWDNESLHNFIDMNKLNVNIIEYKNY